MINLNVNIIGSEKNSIVGYSASAQAVIDLMTGLSTDQKNAIADFVDVQVASGNWALLDVFQFYALGSTNGLKDWKGIYNATNPNGYSFVSGGVDIPGSGTGIVTNYNPATGVKWQTRNAVEGAYVYSNDSITDQNTLIGGIAGGYLVQRTSASRLDFTINAAIRQIVTYPNGWETGLWTAVLEQDTTFEKVRVFKNGVDLGVGNSYTAVERNDTVRVGGKGSGFVAHDGIISGYYAGAGDGFNVPNFATSYTQLLSALGL